jgi:hypothetical protein
MEKNFSGKKNQSNCAWPLLCAVLTIKKLILILPQRLRSAFHAIQYAQRKNTRISG